MNYKELHTKYTALILKIVRIYPELYWEDLEQEASIALFQAFSVWDSKRASFMTLAYKYIKSACYKYMRDEAYIVRKRTLDSPIDCQSLDAFLGENKSIEDFFGTESQEELLDLSITIWDKLKSLAEKEIISWKDFALLYFRFFQQCEYKLVGKYFGCSDRAAQQRIQKIIQRIRPYFLGRKAI